ncbi:hypothetical protein NY057_05190 [Curtobacterium flaccumfaciens]|uniref:hypothetical protein n=1 Tax=Curtobacterium flaccumfaciens TaxID=2035 RepID=UPI00220F652B|nr:hypothetical protein [Curtobacterium flaccumfaciens]UWD83641.1 hypothetical protein NY057_05190 [Curtobacterium flaccumfaciens]
MTEQQNDIQRARDVLAKWRTSQSWFPGPWGVRNEQPGRANWSDVVFDQQGDSLFTYDEEVGDEFSPTHDAGTDPTVARLIVGTAGDPDLLDAIDRVLRLASNEGGAFHEAAAPFASAILAADERMSA